jgi:hypothetical protein
MPEEHAEIGKGGSVAYKTRNCPGWAAEAKKLPPAILNRTSPAAEAGSRNHKEIELFYRAGNPATSEKVKIAVEIFDKYIETLGDVDKDDIMLEVRVDLADLEGCWGTADVVIDAPDRIVVLDWKFGEIIVSAHKNDQLQFYANGALDTIYDHVGDDIIVELVIIQPHGRPDVPQISRWETTAKDLRQWKREYAYALTQNHLAIGPWCKWCPVEISCPELRKRAVEAIHTDLEELQPDELSRWLTINKQLKQFSKALEEFAHHQATAGVQIPKWKLVPKQAKTAWADEEEALTYFKKRLTLAQCAPRVLLSPTKMAKLANVPPEMVKRQSSGTTIAPDSDKRQAIQPHLQQAAIIMQRGKK